MNIAFVSSGNSIHVKKIANALVKRGHQITLYTLPNCNKLLADFDNRVKIVKLPVSGKLGYYLNAPFLKYYLKKNKYDLINAHYASGFGTLARLVGAHPMVLAVFGSDVYEYPYLSKANMKRVIKNLDTAEVITSTSYVMRNKVLEYYNADREIFVTPFGVDLKRFYPVEVEKDEIFEFGIVKKMEHKYGIDILLKAMKVFVEELPEAKVRLTIYGRGTATEEYKNLAKNLGIEENVVFKGFVQNELVPEALSKMDVACFPSESESFGVAAVEAMACEVPVIVSDASGFTEVVENEITGIIVSKKDVTALKDAMIRIYQMTAAERKQMGLAGRKRVVELYDFDKNMDDYENAIKCALNGRI